MPDNSDSTTKSPLRNKLPSLQFYPGDWKRDAGVQSLNMHDRGVWHEILLLMHDSDERGVLLLNGTPMSEAALSNCLGLDKQILTTTLTTLLENGVASRRDDGALFNRRMVRDEQIRQERIKAGHMGGNPILLKQKSTTRVKQKPTPSSSSSSSSSYKKKGEEETPPAPAKEQVGEYQVFLTPNEQKRFLEDFPVYELRSHYLQSLDSHKRDKPDWAVKHTNDNLTLRNWIRRDKSRGDGPFTPRTGMMANLQTGN